MEHTLGGPKGPTHPFNWPKIIMWATTIDRNQALRVRFWGHLRRLIDHYGPLTAGAGVNLAPDFEDSYRRPDALAKYLFRLRDHGDRAAQAYGYMTHLAIEKVIYQDQRAMALMIADLRTPSAVRPAQRERQDPGDGFACTIKQTERSAFSTTVPVHPIVDPGSPASIRLPRSSELVGGSDCQIALEELAELNRMADALASASDDLTEFLSERLQTKHSIPAEVLDIREVGIRPVLMMWAGDLERYASEVHVFYLLVRAIIKAPNAHPSFPYEKVVSERIDAP